MIVSCNTCPAQIEAPFSFFKRRSDAVAYSQSLGWKTSYPEDPSVDVCPNCQAQPLKPKRRIKR